MFKKEVILLSILFGIFFISLVSAEVTCNENSLYLSYVEGEIPEGDIIITSCSSPNSTGINLDGSGVPDYIQKGSDMGYISGTKNLRIVVDDLIPSGLYFPRFYFDDSESVYITLNIEEDEGEIDPTSCQINPSLVSYTQQIQQGTKIPLSKITFNPINCEGQLVLTASSVNIQGGIVTPSGQKPVFISSVESDGINIDIDTEGLGSQTYNSKLKISAFNKQFEIPFTIIVTGGTSGTGDFDVDDLPSCSLTSNIINLNDTHSLVCSGLIPDVDIIPRADNNYIRGINKEVEANQFSWIFQGKKMGNTIIYADFYYLGVPVGDSFFQEIKIQSSSGQTPGTSLILSFTPTLSNIQSGETASIQILDNKTQSLVDDPELYIDGEFIENMTGKSFRYVFESGRNYSIRAISTGYNDLVKDVWITEQQTTFTIDPDKSFYVNTESISLTSEQNCSFLINNVVVNTFPYALNSVGNNTIKCVKDGFTTSNKTIDIRASVIAKCTPDDFEKWRKGKKIICQLNKNVTWNVYKDSVLTEYSGEGDFVEFKINDYGSWEVKSNDVFITGRNIQKGKYAWYKPWTYNWVRNLGYWWILIGAVVVIILYFVFSKKKEEELMLQGNPLAEG